MSRIVVKNLPKAITEEKLRKVFGEKGTITDIQLKYTKDGKFRQFGFIGFQEEHEGEEAIKHFDKTYISTNKVSVEPCAVLGDTSKPKAWSKYSIEVVNSEKGSERLEEKNVPKVVEKKKKKKGDTQKAELLEKYKNDPLFKEYVEVHPNMQQLLKDINELEQKDKGVENADHADNSAVEMEKDLSDSQPEDEEMSDKIANKKISDLEYLNQLKNKVKEAKKVKKVKEKIQLFTVKLKDLPYKCRKKEIKAFFKPNTPYTIRIPPKVHGIAYVGFKTERAMNKALFKNKSFIGPNQIIVKKYTLNNNNSDNKNDEMDPKQSKWRNQEEQLKNEETIGESGRIFFRNLAYTTTEDDIEKLFSKYGLLAEVNLPIDTVNRKQKGFGTVTFLMPEHAVKAYSELDGTIFQGRMLHLLPGKNKDTDQAEDLEESSNFKKKKQAQQKSQAGSSHNWNSLFLGHDAVANVVASTFGMSKEKVLDPHGDSGTAAVRLALGETNIVAQTRKYLEREGVMLDAFSNPTSKRSKTIILVKNLPATTDAKEIRSIFEKHGVLSRVILPPSGVTALVEFAEPSESKKAFTKLAYSKFKNMPLYLEWAPENSLSDKISKENPQTENEMQENDKDTENQTEEKVEEKEEEEEEEPEPDTTLFVKNLNFQTTDQGLREHFECCGKISYASVATKKDKDSPSNRLSMGYGFVRFVHKVSTDKALKTLQQSVLDGKSLELKRSERTLQSDLKPSKKSSNRIKQTGSKILVKNIPFQATRKEINELFGVFGEIKALRLPKKMILDSDSHRGFAFVDYAVASDAKNAFEALCQSTHLYGRRLVLEWASTDDSVAELRKRTAEQFGPAKQAKKIKKSVFTLEENENE